MPPTKRGLSWCHAFTSLLPQLRVHPHNNLYLHVLQLPCPSPFSLYSLVRLQCWVNPIIHLLLVKYGWRETHNHASQICLESMIINFK